MRHVRGRFRSIYMEIGLLLFHSVLPVMDITVVSQRPKCSEEILISVNGHDQADSCVLQGQALDTYRLLQTKVQVMLLCPVMKEICCTHTF